MVLRTRLLDQVGQQQLLLPDQEAFGRCPGRRAEQGEPDRQPRGTDGCGQQANRGRAEVRGRVGDPGDAEPIELGSYRRQVRFLTGPLLPEPVVIPEQPAGRLAVGALVDVR